MCLFLSACKKDHSKENTPATTTAKQKVTLNVGFSQSVTTFSSRPVSTNSLATNSTTDTALTNHIGILYYMVYDSTGKSVQTVTQLYTDSVFGHFSLNLPAGKYTIGIAGGQYSQSVVNYDRIIPLELFVQQLPTLALTNTYLYYFTYPNSDLGTNTATFPGDTFFKLITLTVGNTATSQNVALDRITSILKVNIDDVIPTAVTSITIKLTGSTVAWNYYISDGHTTAAEPNGQLDGFNPNPSYTFTVPASAIGTKNFQVQANLLYLGPFTAEITAYSGSSVTADKTLTGIPGAQGKVTLLSGNLFGGNGLNNGNTSTQFTADTTWKSTTTIGF